MIRKFGMTSVTAIWLLLVAACGGASETREPVVRSPVVAPSPNPTVTTSTPTATATFDLAACDHALGGETPYRIAAHDDVAQVLVPEIELALRASIQHAASSYGWSPADLFCIHVFSSEDAFIAGLQQFLSFGAPFAETFRDNGALMHLEADKGRDAIFMNTSGVRSVAASITHEYMHIVQAHVEHGGAPVWFLEGLSEWEAARLHGDTDPGWIATFLTLASAGLAPELSQLAHIREWNELDDSVAAYQKARLALTYFERIAGPDAAPRLLANEYILEATDFEAAFRALTGLTIEEFDDQLLPFAEELLADD